MSAAGELLRREIKECLLSRAWFSEELAGKLGILPNTCSSIIRELQDEGIPVQPWEGGRWKTVYPSGRKCEVCGAFLSTYNPCNVCNLHGGGCYPVDEA